MMTDRTALARLPTASVTETVGNMETVAAMHTLHAQLFVSVATQNSVWLQKTG